MKTMAIAAAAVFLLGCSSDSAETAADASGADASGPDRDGSPPAPDSGPTDLGSVPADARVDDGSVDDLGTDGASDGGADDGGPGDGGADTGAVGPPCRTDADCDDGNLCNGRERCDPARGCLHADPSEVCADRDPCTRDLGCDSATDSCHYACETRQPGCSAEPICRERVCRADADCDDGFVCTLDRCVDGMCSTGLVNPCDDGDICTIELGCDTEADRCGWACNDRNPSCDCGDAGP